MLPGRSALAAVGVYLFLGAVGLPVFSGGTGGIGHLIGPTGGYLLSYLPAVLLISFIGDGGRRQGTDHRPPAGSRSFPLDLLALSAGALVIFAIGVPWLKLTAGMSWNTAIGTGMLPFLPGDALKVAAAAFISRAFTPRLRLLLSNER
jgi:biotin transport system substrate-specific component